MCGPVINNQPVNRKVWVGESYNFAQSPSCEWLHGVFSLWGGRMRGQRKGKTWHHHHPAGNTSRGMDLYINPIQFRIPCFQPMEDPYLPQSHHYHHSNGDLMGHYKAVLTGLNWAQHLTGLTHFKNLIKFYHDRNSPSPSQVRAMQVLYWNFWTARWLYTLYLCWTTEINNLTHSRGNQYKIADGTWILCGDHNWKKCGLIRYNDYLSGHQQYSDYFISKLWGISVYQIYG